MKSPTLKEMDDSNLREHNRLVDKAVGSTDGLSALVAFIETKLHLAKQTLHARKEMEKTWRSGTDKQWRAVGCYKTKTERLKDAAMHGRIAARNQKEVQMFEAILKRLQA